MMTVIMVGFVIFAAIICILGRDAGNMGNVFIDDNWLRDIFGPAWDGIKIEDGDD
jgi:hypothetical protein